MLKKPEWQPSLKMSPDGEIYESRGPAPSGHEELTKPVLTPYREIYIPDKDMFGRYKPPDNEEYDPDIDAIEDFARRHLVLIDDKDKYLKQDDVFKLYTLYYDLCDKMVCNELHEDVYVDNRKGSFKRILKEVTALETGRPRYDDGRIKVYYGVVCVYPEDSTDGTA